jgi:hydrogenase-1 operon protein HyaF
LTLLPWTPADAQCLDEILGQGPVTILSRGYGNCRITSTRVPNVWRVRFYNSQDVMILDTIEITAIPEVALAAREDFQDSRERVAEVLNWMEQGA